MKKFQKLIFCTLVFFLPSQLALHFWPEYAFVFGVRVDYLSPSIYFTDILVLLLLVLGRTKIKTSLLFSIGVFAIGNIIISISPWVSFWKWLKILELIFLTKYVSENYFLLKTKLFKKVFTASFLIVVFLGIFQFLSGMTLGGIFYFLGERNFNIDTPGIALQEINGVNYLRAYSTFSHPNSFAGYLLYGLSLVAGYPVIFGIIGLVLTFSLSAFVAFITKFFLGKFKLILLTTLIIGSFILPFIPVNYAYPLEVKERLEQAHITKEVITKKFLFGSGLNTFSILNPNLQPVHNIYLLIFSEAGVLGFTIFVYVMFFLINKKNSSILLTFLIIGFFDHYIFTLQQNMLTMSFVFGSILANNKRLKSKI